MNPQDEPKREPEIKVTVKSNSGWTAFWLAGMLFTVGFVPYATGLTFWQQVGKWFTYFFVWPLLLGQKLAGN
jgi:hypothetical protein